jgi:hypothetical protein
MKTSSGRLQMNWPYIGTAELIATAAIGFIVWEITAPVYRASAQGMPIRGGWNWPIVILWDAGLLFFLLAFFWKIYCDANTEIGELELSRPGIFGPPRIRWSEVVRVETFGFSCHVFSKDKKIVLPPYAYRYPESMLSALAARIAAENASAPVA